MRFLSIMPYSIVTDANGVNLVNYLKEFSNSLADPSAMVDNIAFVFTKVAKKYTQENTI